MTTATEEGVVVKAGDRNMLRLGAALVKKAVKNATRLNRSLDIADGAAEGRGNEAEAVLTICEEADIGTDVTVPTHLLRCAQIGISMEIDKVAKAKDEQTALAIDDTKGVDKRQIELERLARHLGYQGDFGLDDDEDEDAEG